MKRSDLLAVGVLALSALVADALVFPSVPPVDDGGGLAVPAADNYEGSPDREISLARDVEEAERRVRHEAELFRAYKRRDLLQQIAVRHGLSQAEVELAAAESEVPQPELVSISSRRP